MHESRPSDDEKGPVTSDELRLIGTPFRRVDGRAKVTGQTRFADDLFFPRMVHMKLVRSTVPHARIVSIDTSKAQEMPGVLAFLTGDSMPVSFGILPVSQDEHALCQDKVRFVGDPVVAVAALTEDQAHEAALAVEVEYESLETIATVDEAISTAEPRIHDYGDEGNLHKKLSMEFGDTEAGFAEADHVFEDVLYFEGNTHLAMEQHATVALTEETDR
ncbi:MAG: molybdopterin-dependent oxidoreductase, partial [Planctomycetes bacterium]|nr:molybdopterin-dependent oxidoreductase [Planctomycetota bacterium]